MISYKGVLHALISLIVLNVLVGTIYIHKINANVCYLSHYFLIIISVCAESITGCSSCSIQPLCTKCLPYFYLDEYN